MDYCRIVERGLDQRV